MPGQKNTPRGDGGHGRRGVFARVCAFWQYGPTDAAKRGPRVLWRMQRWGLIFALGPPLLSTGIALFGVTRGGFRMGAEILVVYLFTFLIVAMQFYRIRRVSDHASSIEFRVCPECGYSLVDLAETGTCPECGTAYTRAGLWEVWTRG